MSTRTSSAFALLLAGCGQRAVDTAVLANAEAEQRAAEDDEGLVLCAHGSEPLARTCAIDRERRGGDLVLTLHHPDGSFRRLLVATDGRGVVAADGAEPARVAVVDADRIDVAFGTDRYRLPATVRPRQ